MENKLRLGVNIDHVATIRNARGSSYPDPVEAAMVAYNAGADGITAHLREDRRHIIESDIGNISKKVDLPLNFEMAATGEMREIALRYQPNAVCLVPENRLELTTEGGLDVIKNNNFLRDYIAPLKGLAARFQFFWQLTKNKLMLRYILGRQPLNCIQDHIVSFTPIIILKAKVLNSRS